MMVGWKILTVNGQVDNNIQEAVHQIVQGEGRNMDITIIAIVGTRKRLDQSHVCTHEDDRVALIQDLKIVLLSSQYTVLILPIMALESSPSMFPWS